jgi:hypothetical protein
MVTIVDYKLRMADSENPFYALLVQGGVEMVRSKETGKFYATARTASIPSTFNEEQCMAVLGTKLPGKIERVACEPYEYTIAETGEVISLDHSFVYNPEEHESMEEAVLGQEVL